MVGGVVADATAHGGAAPPLDHQRDQIVLPSGCCPTQVIEVNYVSTKRGADPAAAPKTTFITKAGDLGCGAGYYK